MAGKNLAVESGAELVSRVAELSTLLDLEVHKQFELGRRLWGAKRLIDVVLIHKQTRKALGIECKVQNVGGTAEEKLPATILDIESWPMSGLIVFAGVGFSPNMKAYLLSTGKAVEYDSLEPWLRLYFGLPITPVSRKAP
jgi:hypothetical protein